VKLKTIFKESYKSAEIDGLGYYISRIPGRKSIALAYSEGDNITRVAAWFRCESEAEQFARWGETVAELIRK
jgi:hypothetical protein